MNQEHSTHNAADVVACLGVYWNDGNWPSVTELSFSLFQYLYRQVQRLNLLLFIIIIIIIIIIIKLKS